MRSNDRPTSNCVTIDDNLDLPLFAEIWHIFYFVQIFIFIFQVRLLFSIKHYYFNLSPSQKKVKWRWWWWWWWWWRRFNLAVVTFRLSPVVPRCQQITQTILFIILHSKDECDPIVHWDSRHTCLVTQEMSLCERCQHDWVCVCERMYETRFCDLCRNSTTCWRRRGYTELRPARTSVHTHAGFLSKRSMKLRG